MRILQSKLLATAGILAGLWALAGCSSMSENECLATDWRTVGYEDGVSGYSGDRVGQYRKACTKHGVSPDLNAYQGGRDQGLLEFCKPLNGFRTGAHGRGYNGICPDALDGPFLEAYESGRQLYNLRSRVNSAANEINSMRAESEQIDVGLVSTGTQILNPALTQEQRAQLLVDTKHMAERKGEIKARLPQLENDLQLYQHELEDYRSTLRYVE